MKNILKPWFVLSLFAVSVPFACKKDNSGPLEINGTQMLSGNITTDMTLNENTSYTLKGQVFVKNNATLTIPAGTTVLVEAATAAENKGALIITRGSKLVVNGTKDKPVVFTSSAAAKAPGDWIGIIVLGKAATNGPGGLLHVSGLPSSADTEFGGSTDNDNSGSIKYLRLEYPGGLNPAQEAEWALDMASGLSLNGVGSATTVENVMVEYSRDDAFQFVGGKVNAKYLIAYNSGDDSFDFDRGYTGKLQFLIGYNKAVSTVAIRSNGVESLNDVDASDITPYTRPVISNMTIIGPEGTDANMAHLSQGVYIRKNTRFNIANSIIAGYSNGGLMLCPKTKPILVNNLGSEFKYNLINADYSNRTFTYDTGGDGTNIVPDPDVTAYATQMTDATIQHPSVNRNTVFNGFADIQLSNVYSSTINLTPGSGSAALSGANFTGADFSNSFFTSVPFRGAIGTDNWAAAGAWIKW